LGDLCTFDPYGQPLRAEADGTVDAQNVPDNQPGKMDYGWLGRHQRPYRHAGALSLVQMGARPYSPLLGRFLSVDPVEGGSANDYVGADPINKLDLDGRCWAWSWVCDAGHAVVNNVKNNWQTYLTVGVTVGCVFMTAGGCLAAGVALWAVQTGYETITTHRVDFANAAVNLGTTLAGGAAGRALAGGWRTSNIVRAAGRHWKAPPVRWRPTLHNWGKNAYINQAQMYAGHVWNTAQSWHRRRRRR
jgi:RHS repeat-associated protein